YDGKGSTLYYRLTQYDYNGDYEILGVQSIVCTNLPEDSWITINTDIFNNIIINFLATQGEKYEIKLYDLHGKLIFYQTGTTNNTYEHLVISTYGIPSSIYLVDVHTTIHNKTQKVYLKELDF
ncbi:MAG: T9SS type A sorting domain-containing protein, partial [Bacteroidales bacterium]